MSREMGCIKNWPSCQERREEKKEKKGGGQHLKRNRQVGIVEGLFEARRFQSGSSLVTCMDAKLARGGDLASILSLSETDANEVSSTWAQLEIDARGDETEPRLRILWRLGSVSVMLSRFAKRNDDSLDTLSRLPSPAT